MNTQSRKGLLLLAVLALACGRSAGSPAVEAATTPTGGLGSHATLRLLGVSNPGLASATFDVDDVAVFVNGSPVAVDVSASQGFDLTVANQAWNVATFDLPAAGSTVHVVLKLAPSGVFARAGMEGAIDTCGPAIEFEFPAEWIALHGHAVVSVDLDRSLSGEGAELAFLPDVQVLF